MTPRPPASHSIRRLTDARRIDMQDMDNDKSGTPVGSGTLDHDDMFAVMHEVSTIRQAADKLDQADPRAGRRVFERLGMMVVAMYRTGVTPATVLDLVQEVADMPEGQLASSAALTMADEILGHDAKTLMARGPCGIN